MRFRFEKLEIGQEARAISRSVYVIGREFPKHEVFVLTSQIRSSLAIKTSKAPFVRRNGLTLDPRPSTLNH